MKRFCSRTILAESTTRLCCLEHGPTQHRPRCLVPVLGTVVTERRTVRADNPSGDPASLRLSVLHPEVQVHQSLAVFDHIIADTAERLKKIMCPRSLGTCRPDRRRTRMASVTSIAPDEPTVNPRALRKFSLRARQR